MGGKVQSTVVGLIAAFVLVACATVSSTPDAPAVADAARARAGQQHPQIIAQFGGEVTGPTSVYVKGVGEKVATAAGLPGRCTFTVIGSDVVNAFAVPGCYIYITRGLLAIMNSEDELASVLGHEVGHVVADHSARRQNASTLSGLGALAVGILTGSGDLAQLAGQAAQVWTLGYSRDQEFESDDLGVRYLLRSGYNPFAAADMLDALGVNDALTAKTSNREAGSEIPAWARSHPLSADRVTRATAQAQAGGGVRGQPPEKAAPYLVAIRGMIYGDDPEQGFVNGRTFSHPALRIAFEAPTGFTLTNTPASVNISGANAKAQFSGGALPAEGLEAYARAVLSKLVGQSPVQVGQAQRTTINGLETVLLPARAQAQSGQVVDVSVSAYRVGNRVYHFIALAPQGQIGALDSMVRSMRTLSDAQVAALRARVIDVVNVGSRDTVQTLAQRMAFDDFRVERFLALNGLNANTPLPAQVKIVRYAS
ncbi:MAG: M48 family metalloprotease [Alphaproteobacteria bacterium]|nr:M48 family metalloprotease [Alphaproteobacteria bacterium]